MEGTEHLSHNPKTLLRELTAVLKIRDIQEWADLKEAVAAKWWESGLRALLFVSGLGLLVTVVKLVPSENPLLHDFIVAWFAIYVLTGIACVEFLIAKFRALRRMVELMAGFIDGERKAGDGER